MDVAQRSAAIRQARLDSGLTQEGLATRAGIAQPNLAGYESGRRPISAELVDPQVVWETLSAAVPRFIEQVVELLDE